MYLRCDSYKSISTFFLSHLLNSARLNVPGYWISTFVSSELIVPFLFLTTELPHHYSTQQRRLIYVTHPTLMRRYNIVSRILLIPTVITFTLAVPVVQEKRQSRVDEVHVPEDVITMLGKRTREQDLDMLWDGLRYYDRVWGNRNRNQAGVHLNEPALPPDVPPPNPAEVHVPEVPAQPQDPAGVQVPEVHVPPQNPVGVPVPEVHAPPQPENPADSDRESMELDSDAPLNSKSGDLHSTPTSPEWSTGSEDWHTAPSSIGSPTESESESDHWSTISNAPSAGSQAENLKAADAEMRGKAQVSRRSSESGGFHTVNVAQMELRSAVDRFPQN